MAARSTIAVWALLTLLCFASEVNAASRIDNLYQASTIVAGTCTHNRPDGFALCLRQVMVKVSGDPSLRDDPAVEMLAARADTFVSSFDYHDRMAGIPVHDEQGSRDRPHDLTVTFEPSKIDTALRAVGRKPWTAPRPDIVMFTMVETDGVQRILTADERFGRDLRDALAAEAARLGLPVILPTVAQLADAGVVPDTVLPINPADLSATVTAIGGDVGVAGHLVWSAVDQGWRSDWMLARGDTPLTWQVRGGSFDRAFREGLGQAARVLSGNSR